MIEDETQTNSFRMFSDLYTHVHRHCDTNVTSQRHTHACIFLHKVAYADKTSNLGKILSTEKFLLFRH